MQKITVLCVGKLKEPFYEQAVKEYEKRLSRYCKLELLELPEQRLGDEPSEAEIRQALKKEAALVEQKLPKGGALIAMCIEGQEMSSVALSQKMQQLAARGEGASHGLVFCVHRVARGDERDNAARPHLVQRFCEKVVVDVETQFVVGFVVHLILSERDVTDGKVVKIPPVGGFKSCHRDVGLGVELPGDAPGNAVQLHAVQTAPGHALRQHPEEIAHTAGRLQNVAGAEAHLFYRVVNGADHSGAGVVGVEGRGPGRFIFLRGQKLFQFGVLLGPGSFGWVEGIRHAAPAGTIPPAVPAWPARWSLPDISAA